MLSLHEPSPDVALALDIGATKLGATLVDGSGRAHGWVTTPTLRESGPDAVIERLFTLADTVLETQAARIGTRIRPVAVGVACGGPMDVTEGMLLGPLHLPGWDEVPIVRTAESRFEIPGMLANDGSAGAWAEYRFGAAAGSQSMIYLTVSSGMGGGAVLDGRLLRGAHGNGGEFGHLLWRDGGRRCTCGRLGCAEAYVAGTQLAERAREALRGGRSSVLSEEVEITAAIIHARRETDALSGELWSEAMAALGSAVTDLGNLFEPEVVVIGGGLTNAGWSLFEPVRDAVARDGVARPGEPVRIVPAALGAAVCAIGVGALALDAVRPEHTTKERAHV